MIITATSVGYGDKYPETNTGKILCIFFCPFAVGLMSASIGQTVTVYMEKRATKQASSLFLHDFALDDFIHMTAKDTDKVSRAEYLTFMLIMMKKVDQPLVDRLNAQFNMLDADNNGYLEPVDLEIMKERKAVMRRNAVTHHHQDTKFRPVKTKKISKTQYVERNENDNTSAQPADIEMALNQSAPRNI